MQNWSKMAMDREVQKRNVEQTKLTDLQHQEKRSEKKQDAW